MMWWYYKFFFAIHDCNKICGELRLVGCCKSCLGMYCVHWKIWAEHRLTSITIPQQQVATRRTGPTSWARVLPGKCMRSLSMYSVRRLCRSYGYWSIIDKNVKWSSADQPPVSDLKPKLVQLSQESSIYYLQHFRHPKHIIGNKMH